MWGKAMPAEAAGAPAMTTSSKSETGSPYGMRLWASRFPRVRFDPQIRRIHMPSRGFAAAGRGPLFVLGYGEANGICTGVVFEGPVRLLKSHLQKGLFNIRIKIRRSICAATGTARNVHVGSIGAFPHRKPAAPAFLKGDIACGGIVDGRWTNLFRAEFRQGINSGEIPFGRIRFPPFSIMNLASFRTCNTRLRRIADVNLEVVWFSNYNRNKGGSLTRIV